MAKNRSMRSQKGQEISHMTEDQAREHLEKIRWPNGPVCIDCGSVEVYKLKGTSKSTRPGLIKCRSCKAQFTVTVNTVLEDSHIPLAKWVKGFHMMCASKKGVSALQLQRELGLGSYKTAWHMAHRIRYAMEQDITPGMFKGQIQADEAYIGGKYRVGSGEDRKSQFENKTPVVVLVETNGRARSKPLERVNSQTLGAALMKFATSRHKS
jgi:transposase-like protein